MFQHRSRDFAACYSTAPLEMEPGSRESWGKHLLDRDAGNITPQTMMALLRDHNGDIFRGSAWNAARRHIMQWTSLLLCWKTMARADHAHKMRHSLPMTILSLSPIAARLIFWKRQAGSGLQNAF